MLIWIFCSLWSLLSSSILAMKILCFPFCFVLLCFSLLFPSLLPSVLLFIDSNWRFYNKFCRKEGLAVVVFRTKINLHPAETYFELLFNCTAQTHSIICYGIKLKYLIHKTAFNWGNSFFSDSLSCNKILKNLSAT